MRREDHRMPAAECDALLQRAEVLRLGIADDGGPYVVPVNFGYEDGRIYVHGAREGRRIDAARRGERVCFEVDEGQVTSGEAPCEYSSRFRSVIGYGIARLLETDEEKRRGLGAIMRHYGGPAEGITPEKLRITSVTEIVIASLDGKWHD